MSASIMALMLRPRAARAAGLDQLRVDATARCAGGEAGGQRVERAAHLVDLGDPGGVERRDQHAAAGRVDDEAVLLEQAQRLQHRLARHGQLARRCLPASAARRARAMPSLIASSRAR